jgi:Zn-dependent metalloprotease
VRRFIPLLVAIGVLVCVGTASAASGDAFRPAGITAADTAVEAATALVEQRPMRVDGADVDELVVAGQARGVGGTTIVRFDQELRGVPVLGGEVVVTVDARRRVLAADGEVLDRASIAFGPTISAAEAQQLVRAAYGKGRGEDLEVTKPALVIYDARIVGGPGPPEPVLTWDFEVTNGADLHRRVFVDATTGYIVQTMDLIRTAKERYVCDAANSNSPLSCADRSEGDPPSLIADVNDAYDFAGATYDFYRTLGRDSIDGAGMPIVSMVRFCFDTCPYPNAFWDSGNNQMVYGLGWAAADDIVAHELTHGVTAYTSGLLYWYQSGAINEAMSDIMGEFVDLANPGSGDRTDTAANRWLIGEDLSRGTLRDMENPPVFGDPDRVGSPLYWTLLFDWGGVHINSGIVNKTAFLIADGGTFNGQTVAGIGLTKSAWLWYQTGLTLRASSSFVDLADALDATCSTLTTLGAAGITSADCLQVTRAALATELRTVPPNATVPAYCSSGRPIDVFNDGFDSGPTSNWTIGRTAGTADLWFGSSETSPDGADMHWASALSTNARGVDSAVRSDSTMAMTTGVVIPTGESYLRFSHWYWFEADDRGENSDGGVIEYSAGGGAWTDIAALTTTNGYTGLINASHDNPLGGQPGYVNVSNGPVVTRVALTTLAGQTVKFRFRIGTDSGGGGYGWYIDSARIYGCSADAPAITSISPATGSVGGGTTITLTGAGLDNATGVLIGGVAATNVTVVAGVGWRGATTVTAVTPARASSLVDVAVTTPTGTVTSSEAFRYGRAEPTIAGVSPASGPLAGGTTITITGADLTGTTNVTVGGILATGVTVVNATTVTAVTPAHAAGVVAVALSTPGGAVSAAGAFTYADPPLAAAPTSPAIAAPTTAKTLPAAGRWKVNFATNIIRVFFARQQGTTYAITAQRDGTVRKGTCKQLGTTIRCGVKAPNGRWRVTITPKVNGKTGKAIVRVVQT